MFSCLQYFDIQRCLCNAGKLNKLHKINKGTLLKFEEATGAKSERRKQHFVAVIGIWVLFYTKDFLFLSKFDVLSSTALLSVNLSSLSSLKRKVWREVTVTPLKSMCFLWGMKSNFLCSWLSMFNLLQFLLITPHMTFPAELILPSFFLLSLCFFFSSLHFPVSISAHYCQHNWQPAVGSFHLLTGGTFYGRTQSQPNKKLSNGIKTTIRTSDCVTVIQSEGLWRKLLCP